MASRTVMHGGKEFAVRTKRLRNGNYAVKVGPAAGLLRSLFQPRRRFYDQATGKTYTAPGFPLEFDTEQQALDAGEAHVRGLTP